MINTENRETVTQNFTRELYKTMAKFDLTDFSNREKEREGKREGWEAMDSGIAFLCRGGSKDQDFCWGSIDCPIYWP